LVTVAQVIPARLLSADAFATEPKLADDLNNQFRYNAACSATLAAARQEEDAKNLPDKVVAGLRRQGLQWLRADLALYAKLAERDDPATKQAVRQRLTHWQTDANLASVRHPWSLRCLHEVERKPWHQLWQDVEALLQKTRDAK
jgi:hypothetical protein